MWPYNDLANSECTSLSCYRFQSYLRTLMSDEDKKTNTAKLCLSIKTVTSNTKKKKKITLKEMLPVVSPISWKARVERHLKLEQQLFQGGHCCIDFLTLFPSNNAQQRLSDRLIGRVCTCKCVPLYQYWLQITVRRRFSLNEMCNLNTCHSPRIVGQNCVNNQWENQAHIL